MLDCHPLRFSHLSAVNSLRNVENAFEVQVTLGHTTLQMMQTHLALAQADLDAARREASPVQNRRS